MTDNENTPITDDTKAMNAAVWKTEDAREALIRAGGAMVRLDGLLGAEDLTDAALKRSKAPMKSSSERSALRWVMRGRGRRFRH